MIKRMPCGQNAPRPSLHVRCEDRFKQLLGGIKEYDHQMVFGLIETECVSPIAYVSIK